MRKKLIGLTAMCLLLITGCQSPQLSVSSDNTENIIVEDTSREPQQETNDQHESEKTVVLVNEDEETTLPLDEEDQLLFTESVKSLNYDIFSYIDNSFEFVDPDTWEFTGQLDRVFCNSAYFLYKVAEDSNVYVGTNGSEYGDVFGCTAVGLNLGNFVINMGDSITAKELSQLLDIKLTMYDGVQAEPGYINWFGETHFVNEDEEYVVYIYSPSENLINSETVLSSDSFIIFQDVYVNCVYFDPLKSRERDSWIDNMPLVYTLLHCPFVGLPYDTEGMEINDYGDGRLHITYTDPSSGWVYEVVDADISGTSISAHSYVDTIRLTACEIFPDMPDMMSYTELSERYANFSWSALYDMTYWDKATADAYFAVLVKQDFTKFEEVDYLGVGLILYDNGQSYITKDTEVEIYRYLQYIWD